MAEDKNVSYFCLGLGIGVAIGILFAPKSGEETRLLLRSKADESKDYLKKVSDESADYLKRKTGELKDSATDLADKSKLALQRQKEQLAAAVEAGRQAYKESVATEADQEAGA
jgi:gas vesicle protein